MTVRQAYSKVNREEPMENLGILHQLGAHNDSIPLIIITMAMTEYSTTFTLLSPC